MDSYAMRRLRALIVDDNEANRAFALAALGDESFEVEAAASADDAFASFETFEPDCVLLDVRMPGKDGFTACRELRARPRGASVTVVFVTAARNAECFDQAVAAGADDFITKPVMANELVARICSAVRAKALSQRVIALRAILQRHRTQLALDGASGEVAKVSRLVEELTAHVEHMFELSGDLARGALEESIVSLSRPAERAILLEERA